MDQQPSLRAADYYYWVGGSGNWSGINHWATTSGGAVLQPVVPSQNDNVFFDANSGFLSGSNRVVINVTANCHNMTWAGAQINEASTEEEKEKLHQMNRRTEFSNIKNEVNT